MSNLLVLNQVLARLQHIQGSLLTRLVHQVTMVKTTQSISQPQVGDTLLSVDPHLVGRSARHMEESVVASLVQGLTQDTQEGQEEGLGWSQGQLATLLQGMEVAKIY